MSQKKILKIFSFSSSDGWTYAEILEFQKNYLNSDWILFSNTDGKYSVDTFVNTHEIGDDANRLRVFVPTDRVSRQTALASIP
jgi:hypothetical protein